MGPGLLWLRVGVVWLRLLFCRRHFLATYVFSCSDDLMSFQISLAGILPSSWLRAEHLLPTMRFIVGLPFFGHWYLCSSFPPPSLS